MEFSFNEGLILQDNSVALNILSNMNKSLILQVIKEVAKKEVTLEGLKQEFIEELEKYPVDKTVTGEHIKSYFVIVLNGVSKILESLASENKCLAPYYKEGELYENVFSYIDELVDEVDFEDLFKEELLILNQ